MSDNGWSLGRRGGLMLAAAAVAAAVVLVVIVIRAQVSAPEPHPAGRIDVPTHSSQTHGGPHSKNTQEAAPPLGPSKPVHLRIPALGVDTPVYPIGLASDGTLAVPQPGPHLNNAAWFENSPTPGQPGPRSSRATSTASRGRRCSSSSAPSSRVSGSRSSVPTVAC